MSKLIFISLNLTLTQLITLLPRTMSSLQGIKMVNINAECY